VRKRGAAAKRTELDAEVNRRLRSGRCVLDLTQRVRHFVGGEAVASNCTSLDGSLKESGSDR